jgi:GTP pyrophosphokinase
MRIEMQIRTEAMDRVAEEGVAAHWRYKDQSYGFDVEHQKAAGGRDPLVNLRHLVQVLEHGGDAEELVEHAKLEMFLDQVFVFTPKGQVLALPQGATPVDFAFAIHTEVGNRTIGARVNGRLVPLESTLDNGDTVEIFTSKSPDAGPSRDWLNFVKSARARNKIKHWFSKERRESAIEQGKESLARAMRKQNLPLQRMLSGEALLTLAHDMHYADVSALYAAIGESHVSAQNIVRKLVDVLGGDTAEDLAETAIPTRKRRSRPAGDPGVVVAGDPDVWVRLSRCCTPVPGDEIVGFVTRGNGVSVHRTDCVNVANLQTEPDRMVDVKGSPGEDSVFLVAIQVEALDRPRLLSDVTRVLSDQHVNILSASVATNRDRVAVSRFSFEMGDPKHLGHVLKAVRSVDGVFDVYRVTS